MNVTVAAGRSVSLRLNALAAEAEREIRPADLRDAKDDFSALVAERGYRSAVIYLIRLVVGLVRYRRDQKEKSWPGLPSA